MYMEYTYYSTDTVCTPETPITGVSQQIGRCKRGVKFSLTACFSDFQLSAPRQRTDGAPACFRRVIEENCNNTRFFSIMCSL